MKVLNRKLLGIMQTLAAFYNAFFTLDPNQASYIPPKTWLDNDNITAGSPTSKAKKAEVQRKDPLAFFLDSQQN